MNFHPLAQRLWWLAAVVYAPQKPSLISIRLPTRGVISHSHNLLEKQFKCKIGKLLSRILNLLGILPNNVPLSGKLRRKSTLFKSCRLATRIPPVTIVAKNSYITRSPGGRIVGRSACLKIQRKVSG